jgi:hypothetical protein
MSNLLYPGPMQFNNAPPPQPAPMIPQQQLAQQGFAQRFKQNLGPILQAAGMGLASGNWGGAAAAMPGLAERRQQQMQEQQVMAQEQQRLNATAEWAKTQDPEVAMMLEKGMINGSQAVQMIQQKRQAAQGGDDFINAGDGRLFNKRTQEWVMAPNSGQDDFSKRKAIAEQYGLSPDDPAYKSFVLTGKMPREDQAPLTATDKKAILEADEQVMSNQNVINMLTEAEKLNSEAYEGANASDRAKAGTKYWDWAVPDSYAEPGKSAKTVEFENLVMTQALQSLKSIFGGNPTEGERAILVELQASVDKPASVRKEILARAKRLAQARLQFNQQRAEEMRGGTYYKTPQGGGNRPVSEMSDEELEALANGQ